MQLTIPLKTLKSMVDALKDNIPKSPPQEVLNNFLIVAKDDLLTITATDLTLWLIRREDCDRVKQEGAIALNAKKFADTVKSLTGEDVEIKVSEGYTTIRCGKSKFKLPVINPRNYPSVPKNDDVKSFAIATDILRDGITATLKTVSNDDTKPSLMGVHLHEYSEILEGEDDPTHFLAFTSSDGQRGSYFRVVTPPLADLSLTVPTRALKEVEHIKQAETEILLTNNHIWFNSHALTIASPLIAQQFPPVRTLLKNLRGQVLSGSIKCEHKELIASLKRVNALSGGDIYDQKVDLSIEGEELMLVSDIGGVGRVEESLPCDVGTGKFRSLFNPKYLLHILDTIRAKYVKLEAYEGRGRCVFISPCDGTDQETFLMAIAEKYKPQQEEDDED